LSEGELEQPSLTTIGKLIYNTVVRFVDDQTAAIIFRAFVVLMLWGYHGDLQLLGRFWSGWTGPGSDPATRAHIIPALPFDQEWISFFAGALIVVGIPCLLIKFVYHERLSDYGLGLPPPGRRRLAVVASTVLFVVSFGGFYIGAQDAAMKATYPLYQGQFSGTGQFLLYELGYLAFFVVIEFNFRGYLLFGLYGRKDRDGGGGRSPGSECPCSGTTRSSSRCCPTPLGTSANRCRSYGQRSSGAWPPARSRSRFGRSGRWFSSTGCSTSGWTLSSGSTGSGERCRVLAVVPRLVPNESGDGRAVGQRAVVAVVVVVGEPDRERCRAGV
jgi:hypothetical protein